MLVFWDRQRELITILSGLDFLPETAVLVVILGYLQLFLTTMEISKASSEGMLLCQKRTIFWMYVLVQKNVENWGTKFSFKLFQSAWLLSFDVKNVIFFVQGIWNCRAVKCESGAIEHMERPFQSGTPGVNVFGQVTRLQKMAKDVNSHPQKLQAGTLLTERNCSAADLPFSVLFCFVSVASWQDAPGGKTQATRDWFMRVEHSAWSGRWNPCKSGNIVGDWS